MSRDMIVLFAGLCQNRCMRRFPVESILSILKSKPGFIASLGCLLCSVCLLAVRAHGDARDYFRITVVDADTGRGVPLVELKTTHEVRFWTDSNGIVAINDPEMMGHKVYFHVKSHGYEYPKDGFGNRGLALQVTPGGQGQIKIKRLNIAERLYRITGAGLYRDSVLLGLPTPLKQPLLSGKVMGQDTVMATPYRGKLFWLWGDTNRPAYPLGNFYTSCATSLLPGQGGLDPSVGVDLTYWVDGEGFSKKMIPMPHGGPVWMGGLFTLKDDKGQERLFGKYAQVESDAKAKEVGLAVFNDEKAVFEKVRAFDTPLVPDGHPFRATAGGQPYIYFSTTSGEAFPLVRVRADVQHVSDPKAYEAFTCLAPGSRYDKANTRLERGADGKLLYGWKADTATLGFAQRKELVAAGKVKADESPFQLRDVETDATLQSHGGSVFWNAYRQRWIMITGQSFGSPSFLGEIWFAEADTPSGPWVYAKKVVTHQKYTFYNPTQHPFFDQDGGRLIYFEGTYTSTYSGNEDKTPRYDYNQMMYRLALDDARLALPAPVYALKGASGAASYALRETVDAGQQWPQVQNIPFFAVPPSRRREGLIPIYRVAAGLQSEAPADAKPLFYALPPAPATSEKPSPAIVPLYENRDASGARWYAIETASTPTETRAPQPLCRVWRNPSSVLALDFEAKAQ